MSTSTLPSLGLTKAELKDIILPNIGRIGGLHSSVGDAEVLAPLDRSGMEKALWDQYRIRFVDQKEVPAYLRSLTGNGPIRGLHNSPCVSLIVRLDSSNPATYGAVRSILKCYQLLFIDVHRSQVLTTKETHDNLLKEERISLAWEKLEGFEWKEIRLPKHDDAGQLALCYLAAQTLKWGHSANYHNHAAWEQFLQGLRSLKILSPENARVLTTFVENKPDADEVKKKKDKEEVTLIVLDGVDKLHSLEFIFTSVKRLLNGHVTRLKRSSSRTCTSPNAHPDFCRTLRICCGLSLYRPMKRPESGQRLSFTS